MGALLPWVGVALAGFLAWPTTSYAFSFSLGGNNSFSGKIVKTTGNAVEVQFPTIPIRWLNPFYVAELRVEDASCDNSTPIELSLNGIVPNSPRDLRRVSRCISRTTREITIGAVGHHGLPFYYLVAVRQAAGDRLRVLLPGPCKVKSATVSFRLLELRDFFPPVVTLAVAPSTTVNEGTPLTVRFSAWPSANYFECRIDRAPWVACSAPWTIIGLPAGRHVVAVRAFTEIGVRSRVTRKEVIVRPVANPTVRIVSVNPPGELHSASQVDVTFEASAAPTNRGLCSVDGSAAAPCESPFTVQGFSDGRHVFEVRATSSGVPATWAWVTDRTAPEVAFLSIPSNPANSSSATFAFEANEEDSTFRCALDDAELATCSSPFIVDGLADGTHSFRVVATDPVGNVSEGNALAWTVDTVGPTIFEFRTNPEAPVVSTGAMSVSFTFDESDVQAECAIDGLVMPSCESPFSVSDLSEGEHSVVVRGRDRAGNYGPAREHHWRIDRTAPLMTLERLSPLGSPTRETSASFSLAAPGADHFECQLDLVPVSCGATVELTSLADGEHAFTARAIDDANNASEWSSSSWVVDSTPPTLAVSYPDFQANTISRSFVANFAAMEAANFFCRLDGLETACSSPFLVSELADGVHTFRARAVDTAGNEYVADTVTWTVDATAPTLVIESVTPSWSPTQLGTIEFRFHVDGGGIALCQLDNQAEAPCSSPWAHAGLSDGAHTAHLVAIDAAGNRSVPIVHTWTVAAAFSVTNLTVAALSTISVRVTFRTGSPARAQLHYGVGTIASFVMDRTTALEASLATVHTIMLNGLVPNTDYVTQVYAFDSAGRLAVSDLVTFRTPGP